jgi:hypothetical protein
MRKLTISRTCQACSIDFLTYRPEACYCSLQCAGVGHRKPKVGTCEICAALITSPTGRRLPRFCSDSCRKAGCAARRVVAVEIRFWKKVDRTKGYGPKGECWQWIGAKGGGKNNYGWFSHRSHRFTAHRFSYELHFGPIPQGLLVCHKCDNPPCVRPDHFFLGTHKDNAEDMVQKGRRGVGTGLLTDAQVREMRRRYASGETITEISKGYPVKRSAVSQVVHRHHYPHVE